MNIPIDAPPSASGDGPQCGWYAGCTNTATGLVLHPILGFVPACPRCADKHDLDLVPAIFTEVPDE